MGIVQGIELKPEINHKAIGNVKINLLLYPTTTTRKNRYDNESIKEIILIKFQ